MARQKKAPVSIVSTMLRMPEATHEACVAQAIKERRSLNAQLVFVIEHWLEQAKEKAPHALVSASDHSVT
jgi:hypothetical protein